MKEQNTKFTPTAYFAALLALLRQASATESAESSNELLRSAVYLLDSVTTHVPPALLRAQYTQIVSILSPIISRPQNDVSLLRSSLGCLESLLIAQDGAAWSIPSTNSSPRQALVGILALAVNSKPKVRKRAQETLVKILQNPPPGPAVDHPAAELCAVSALSNLRATVDAVQHIKRSRNKTDGSHEPELIHALQLTKTVASASRGWPSKNIEQLCELLLSISRSRNEFLVMSAFEVFDVILENMSDEMSSPKLQRLLEAIVELKPAVNDVQILPPWVAILSRGYGLMAQLEPDEIFTKVPDLVELMEVYLTSPSHNVRISVSECLKSFFATCVPDTVIVEPSIYDEKVLQRIADLMNGLLSVKYQMAWMEVSATLSALFDSFRWRGNPFFLPIVQAVGNLRGTEAFQGKTEADEVLGSAIRNIGPEAVLKVLPHNLVKPLPNQPGRAWLLPLLRDHVSNTNLSHFKLELVPLSESMYERILSYGNEKTMETKVFETVIQQVWATFPGYCDLPLDLQAAVDQPFAEFVSNLMYKQTELRVDLCRGLQNLVESDQAVIASELTDDVLRIERRTTRLQADQNLQHLAKLASNLLAVLFNVYSQTLPQSRAHILQCINAYLSITPEKDLLETFDRVSKMFESSVTAENESSSQESKEKRQKNALPQTSHTLLDLIVALAIYLPRSHLGRLFALASSIITSPNLSKSEPQLLKKAYKIIPRLAATPTGANALQERNRDLQSLILATTDKTPVPARRDRLLAIQAIVSFMAVTDLHFIPSVLSEIVLACKDSNEKARNTGFDLLVAVAQKISDPTNPENTVIKNHLVPHMPDDAPDAPARIEEVFTMVSAGLAGVAPNMVAASVTALARLLFEFHDQINEETRREIIDTVTMFLESNNREIVRAVLGFVKVVIVLPTSGEKEERDLEERTKRMAPALMLWSKENKGRLRMKVRGILDRCIRRFGPEKVEGWIDGKEERKMIVNIRKRRERARRKKTGTADGDEEADAAEDPMEDRQFDNEFDEAIYGSDDNDDDESEIDGGSGEDGSLSGIAFRHNDNRLGKKNKGRQEEQYIMQDEDDDEPLDLLDPKAQSSITSKKMVRFADATGGNKNRKTRINEDGKLVFGSSSRRNQDQNAPDEDVAMDGIDGGGVDAYVEAVSGPHAVQRGQKGRLKIKGSGVHSKEKSTNTNEKMDLDPAEQRQVGQRLKQQPGSTNGRTSGTGMKPQQTRKGLGILKKKEQSSSRPGAQVLSGKGRIGKKVTPGRKERHGGWRHSGRSRVGKR